MTYRISRLGLTVASMLFICPVAFAQVPQRVYGQSNGVCDPGNVENCVRPNSDGSLPLSASLAASGGWTPKVLAGLSNTPTVIKAAAGQLAMVHCWNSNSAVAFVQIFDSAAGGVTPGTTTPVQSLGIPPTDSSGFTLSIAGLQFSTAITAAASTTAGGGVAPAASLVCNVAYH